MDIVFDRYFPNSLENSARKKMGVGIRRRVAGNIKIPGDWQSFLRNEDKKRELFFFFSRNGAENPAGQQGFSSDYRKRSSVKW